MSFHRILNKIRNENILFSVLLELTHQCNLDCFFCYNNVDLKGKPLSVNQYLQLLKDLREMQVMELIFSGGEPLLHKKFMLLGRKANELGFIVRIKSNGHNLDKKLARQIKEEIAPFMLDISLHGATPETHDRQTCVPGSFNRLIINIRHMIEMGLRIKLSMTLTAWNEDEIEKMINLAKRMDLIFQINTQISSRDDGNMDTLSIAPSLEGIKRTYRLLEKYAGSQTSICDGDKGISAVASDSTRLDQHNTDATEKICGIGSSSITVDPYGNGIPCPQWRRSAGNLHQNSIQDIWINSTELKRVRGLAIEAKQMVAGYGEDGKHMAFCLGQAEKQGHPLTPYDQALTQMDALQKTKASKIMN